MRAPWSPVLTGRERERALETADGVVSALIAQEPQVADARRLAEMALVFATVSARRDVPVDFGAVLQRAIDATVDSALPSRLDGALGFGLAMQQTVALLGADLDVCADIDVGLAAAAEQPDGPDFDLLSGTAGALLYVVERPETDTTVRARQALLGRLAAQASHDERGTFWRRDATAPPDLGVAHGTAGVVAALAALVERGWASGREEALLQDAVAWLLSQRGPTEQTFRFGYAADQRTPSGRLAWCYNDLGMAAALERAARARSEPSWHEAATDLAEHAAQVSFEQSGVVDGGLCHGAAGAGLVFASLAQTMPSAAVSAAAKRWFERLESFRRPWGEAPFGFRTVRSRGLDDDPSLLEGASGIALALEAASGEAWPSWLGWQLGL